MSENDLNPAIAVLESRLVEHDRKGNELRTLINMLYVEAGLAPKYKVAAGSAATSGGAVLTAIRRDSFYGKKQMTAVREYLEMRRVQGNGPATPREIHDALTAGGYTFGAKTDHVAMVNLRALLRKATNVFHRLPGTGAYGLLAWYPDTKAAKPGDGGDGAPARKRSKSKGKAKQKASAATAKGGQQAASGAPAAAAPEGK